jgi:hypothetical protein
LLRELCKDYPSVPDFAYELSETLVDFHVPELPPEDNAAAANQLREALAISDQLLREHPQTTAYAISNVHINHRLSSVERHLNRPIDEEQALQRAIAGQRRITAQFPEIYVHAAWLARMTENAARLYSGTGRAAEARTALQAADAALKPFAEAKPPQEQAVEARQRLKKMLDALPPVPAS